jgi:tape measure domain-containing protein
VAVTVEITANSAQAQQSFRQLEQSVVQSMGSVSSKVEESTRKSAQAASVLEQRLTQLQPSLRKLGEQATQSFGATSSAINAFERVATQALNQITQATSATARATTAMAQQMQASTRSAGASTTAMAQQVTSSARTVDTASENMSGGFTALALGAAKLAVAFTALNVVRTVARSFLENALAMDSVRATLVAVSGSTTQASKEMAFLQGVAQQTGVAVGTLAQQWSGLFAAANPVPGRLEEARQVFTALTEAGARMGKSTDQLGLALYGLTQLVGGTTVQMQELQQQIGDALPGVLPALARELGKTDTELRKMIATGQLMVADTLPALTRAIRSMAGGDGAVATASSEFGRMHTAWTNLMDSMAQLGILAAVVRSVQGVTSVVNVLREGVERLRGALTTLPAGTPEGIQQRLDAIRKEQAHLQNLQQPTGRRTGTTSASELKALERRNELNAEAISLEKQLYALTDPEKAPEPSRADQALEQQKKFIDELTKTPAKIRAEMEKIDKELAIVRGKNVAQLGQYGLDPLLQDFPQARAAREKELLDARQKLNDELLGIDRKAGAQAVGIAGNVAAERAREEVAALEAGLARQIQAAKIGADQQRVLLDQELSDRLTQQPDAYEAIEREAQSRRQAIASEEARRLEEIEVAAITQIRDKRLQVLDAEIRGAGKNQVQAATFERQKVEVVEDASAKIEAAHAKRTEVEQGLSKKTLDARLDDIKREVQAVEAAQDRMLSARQSMFAAEEALIRSQQEGRQLLGIPDADAYRAADSQIKSIQQQRFADAEAALQKQAQDEAQQAITQIENGERLAQTLTLINEEYTAKRQELGFQQATDNQEALNRQLQDYERFVEDVENTLGDFLYDWFSGQIESIEELFDSLLNSFLRMVADMIAYASARTIVIPIITSLVGGVGGAVGLGGTDAGSLLDLLGLANVAKQGADLFGFGSPLGSAIDFLTTSLDDAAVGIGNAFGATVYPSSFVGPVPTSAQLGQGTSVVSGVNTLGTVGGLAAVGGGIYGALNANNTASMAVYAASAAAGAAYAAGASGLLAAAGATAATTGWTGFGLIAAAVLGAIGLILDQVISPGGPSLAVGDFKGLGIGTEGGQLTVTGAVEAEVQKTEGVGKEVGQDIADSLETSLMKTASAMVGAINAIAIDPTALADSTEAALQRAFNDLPTLNSANAEKMEEDIKAQMAFLTARLAAELLVPLSEAFTQVSNLSLDEQIRKLPAAAQGMVQMLDGMNQALNELQNVENADVRGRIHELESRIADFRSRLINDTLHALQRAFSGGQSHFEKALALAIAIPAGVVALHQPLAEVQAMAKAFAPVVSQTTADINAIELQLTPFPDLIGDIASRMHEVRAEIAAAGDDVATAIPLFEQLRVAILAQATAATDVANQLIEVNSILLDQMNPVDQAAAIQSQLTPLTEAIVAGTATQAQIDQAVGLSQELLALGEQTDNLALQQEAIASLEATQALLEEQLLGLTGTTDPQLALVSIQTQALDALKLLNEQMYALFLSSTSIEGALGVITPTTAQTGGLLTLASGGRVPAMLEPGEAVFTPPMTRAQSGALMAFNQAWPRFAFGGIVPGSGDGDTVPAFLPVGSFVLNRNATGALRGKGFQTGGQVTAQGGGPVIHQHITVDLRGAVFRNEDDEREFMKRLEKNLRKLTDPSRLFRPR